MPEQAQRLAETQALVVEDGSEPVCALSDPLYGAGQEGVRAADGRLMQRIEEMERDQVCVLRDSGGAQRWTEGATLPAVLAKDCLTCEVPPETCQGKQLKALLDKYTHALNQRLKELNCLYGISAVVDQPGISLPEIL